ncbi:hypothetical protein ACLOJK_004498 [Asimina triloba]
MPPKKGSRTLPNSDITGTHSVLPHQEETRLPSTPLEWLSKETMDVVPVVSLTEPVGTIASDAEGLVTRAEFSALTELLRFLRQQLTHLRQ